MFSGFGFRMAVVGVIAIMTASVGALLFGGGEIPGPLFVADSKITSSNPYGRGCVMTLKDYAGNVEVINTFTADCYEFPRGTAVYLMGDRVYEY